MEKVLILFIIPLITVLYFELVGRLIVNSLTDTKLQIYFPIGLICALGIIYPTSLLTNYGASFYILLAIYLVLFIVSVILIIKRFNIIDKNINYFGFIVACLIASLLSYYSYNTTLGNLNGFDSVHYLNMVSQNIGLNKLNSKDVYLNIPAEFPMSYYTNEVYYYFAGTFLFCISKLFTLLKVDFFYNISFIWLFQILFNLSIGSIIVELYGRVKNKIAVVACSIPIIFVLGKLYYNSVFGFFGNSWYTICLAYIGLFMLEYLQNRERISKVIYLLLLGMCSFTSSGIYTSLFILFGLFFFSKNHDCLKEYSLVMFIPIYNAFFMERYPFITIITIPMIIMIICFIFGRSFYEIVNKSNNKKFFLLTCILLLFVLSRFYSDGLFDFKGVFDNLSQSSDMSLDYFHISGDITLIKIFKIFVLTLFGFSLTFNHKKKYIMLFFVLTITLFNPFTCNIINRYIKVYYRAYSIIINPFMLCIMFDDLLTLINNKYIKYVVSIIVSALFIINIDFINPIIYHYEFQKTEDYNSFYKMKDDEIDTIKQLKNNIYYFDDEDPYIITGNILTLSALPQAKYLFGKTYIKSKNWSNSENKLYSIFYTPEYLGDYIEKYPDYNNMSKYIQDAGIDYIVVDKNVVYYDEELDIYSFLFYKVEEECNVYPIYENDTYLIYRF